MNHTKERREEKSQMEKEEKLCSVLEIVKEKGYDARIVQVEKGSKICQGLAIKIDERLGATLYADETWDDLTPEQIADVCIRRIKGHVAPFTAEDITKLLTPEWIKKNVSYQIRKKIPGTDAVTKDYLDLELVLVGQISDEASMRIKKPMLENLGLDADELFEIAIKNKKHTVDNMLDLIPEELREGMQDEPMMLVLSNERRCHGATALADKALLKDVADALGSDVLIIPSSVHELICMPYTGENADFIMGIIPVVNEEAVDETERLSDHAYIYRRESGEIEF